MLNKTLFAIISFCLFETLVAQQVTTPRPKTYDFILYDGSESSSMYKFNQNYVTGYRIFSRTIDELIPNRRVSSAVKYISIALFGQPLTHEEGHRSVLTHNGIGSISQPFFNSSGAAYVKGVKNSELEDLRNSEFANYIRLHTAGLESDHMIASKIEELLVFEEESYQLLKEEYILRKLGVMSYHLTSFIPAISPKLKEENNELKRDIVGHDVWGMIRHIHRPNAPFYRYTNFDDLSKIEKSYTKKLAWKSFVNLGSPMLFGKTGYDLNSNLKGNFSLSHSLSPFGDYFEQNIYIYYKKKYKITVYFREFMNQHSTFLAGGFKLRNYKLSDKIHVSSGVDVWNQPLNLAFNSSKGSLGANAFLKLNYLSIKNSTYFIKNVGVFSEVFYKSDGFLPEYASLKSDFGLRIGLSFSY
ncbi:MAG: hypothetical protein COB81_11255 [Flavobacteriaceae bacterium]|nr:MAG: hypothetical protein COB81_11255 [Flavobacteriaceae bacterium]